MAVGVKCLLCLTSYLNGDNMSFWNTLLKPIVGLSPMDGVTDAAISINSLISRQEVGPLDS